MSSLYLIHCSYTDNIKFESIESLYNKVKLIEGIESIKIIYVNNNIEVPVQNIPINGVDFNIICGSNSLAEFSAWNEGWESIKYFVSDDDLVILSNDTLLRNQPFRFCIEFALHKFLQDSFHRKLHKNYICGVTEDLKCIVGRYITSFLLILDGRAAGRLLPDICKLENHASINYGDNLGTDSLVVSSDKKYESLVNKWLLSSGPNSWYKASELSVHNIDMLTRKALSILLEYSLSIKANRRNIAILDLFEGSEMRYLRIFYVARLFIRKQFFWHFSVLKRYLSRPNQ